MKLGVTQQEALSHHGLPPGSVLNEVYTVEAELGQGGFGIVYRARHRDLGPVAIKEYLPVELAVRSGQSVHPRSTDFRGAFEEGLGRFQKEAKQLIRFRTHQSIVSCRDFFRANGTAYLVMDFEEGLSLSKLLEVREAQGKPFEEADLLAVMVPLLEGLAQVHQAGVLHRDIKPSNVLIRREDERPVLIDFGAAKQEFAKYSKSLAPYSPGYAAIEQVSEGRLGVWTDLYGVGAVMWRMVAGGNRPNEPPQPVKAERRLHAKFRGEPDPMPSAQKLGRGRFSERVLRAIDRCLKLGEQERVQDCGELLRLIREDGAMESKLLPPTTPEAKSAWTHGDKAVAVALFGTVLFMLLLVGFNQPENQSALERAATRGDVEAPRKVLSFDEADALLFPLFSFRVEPEPKNARVRVLNIRPPYLPGMKLSAGKYRVEVSAAGYETRREWVEHDGVGSYPIRLERVKPRSRSVVEEAPLAPKPKPTGIDEKSAPGTLPITQPDVTLDGIFGISKKAGKETRVPTIEPKRNKSRSRTSLVGSTAAFTRGSHKDDVLRIQGTPSGINRYPALNHEVWRYGSSTVDISLTDGRVTEWSNRGNLKVRLDAGSN